MRERERSGNEINQYFCGPVLVECNAAGRGSRRLGAQWLWFGFADADANIGSERSYALLRGGTIGEIEGQGPTAGGLSRRVLRVVFVTVIVIVYGHHPASCLASACWMLEAVLEESISMYFEFLPAKSRSRFLFWIPSRQIEESISILNFFPPNRGVDFYFEFLPANRGVDFYFELLPAKSRSRFLISTYRGVDFYLPQVGSLWSRMRPRWTDERD